MAKEKSGANKIPTPDGVVGMETKVTGTGIKKPEQKVDSTSVPTATTKQEEEKPSEAKGGETVTVPKEDLQMFIKRLNDLEADNRRLLEAADKGRLHNIDAKLAGDQPLVRTVKLSRMTPGGPIIVAWQLVKNVSYMDGTRRVEDQVMNVIFENGESSEMRLIDFYRQRDNKTVAEIISRKKPEKPGALEILEVETKDGQRLEIPLKFVN